ncbi:hypothetical protein H257_12185 [Aphanomyces astaci]|uniref:Multifunctional methyltransferase subunit TRM112 n=1 Tax=Aphanomyces astaci TaxID=112090 RepID=W4G1L8_APHAT|nr:hypothetical protein H257_12185 [Aphanomyces astaci]ETV72828.1 hypothetical protein H257_12185 [Aphanomyces astaci]|eukprot:XP_009837614.1 hypothetical protein H257_12185 [Aphanomyces astaci]
MRLLTHNMLVCNIKACVATARQGENALPLNYPLKIQVDNESGIDITDTNYSKDFVLHILKSIDWTGLVQTVAQLNHPELPQLPQELPVDVAAREDILRAVHHIIFDTTIIEGELVCNNCGRSYPIKNGIPNMLLEEDEM